MSQLTPAATAKNGNYGRQTEKHLEKIADCADAFCPRVPDYFGCAVLCRGKLARLARVAKV
jgi:hypothetical protein